MKSKKKKKYKKRIVERKQTPAPMNFKRSMQNFLDKHDIKAYRFSEITGYPNQKMWAIMNGRQKFPSLPWIIIMARKLGLKPGRFLDQLIDLDK
jgi:hypothetical protein